MKYGLVYSTAISVAKPGPYQIRAAVLDQAGGKVGTANQFLMIPRQPRWTFLLSGIVSPQMLATEDDITPAARPESLARGQAVPFRVRGDRRRGRKSSAGEHPSIYIAMASC